MRYYNLDLDESQKAKYSLEEAGKSLRVGRNKLCKLLRILGIFDDYNLPYPHYKQWFEIDYTERNGYGQCTARLKPTGLAILGKIIQVIGILNVVNLSLSDSFDTRPLLKVVEEKFPKFGNTPTWMF